MNIMLSGGYRKENLKVYKSIDQGLSMAYLPSWFSEESLRDFSRFKKQFKKNQVSFIPLDKLTKTRIKKMFQSDIIYIEGGNTYLLLHYIRKFKLFNKFKKFVKTKILMGMSAGSIIQTPNINLAGIPYFNADDNLTGVRNRKSLSLVNFEIFPHFEISDKKELKELVSYSKINKSRTIYLLPDGSSIMVKNKKKTFIGRFWTLKNGELKKGSTLTKSI